MIPRLNIISWSAKAPWADERQVEQDLIISRAIIELFNDPFLRDELRFRGGTALNKLHFPEPLRYSEDIDLVRTSHGPIGPILDRLREVLQPWLGRAAFDQSRISPKLKFKIEAEDRSSPAPLRLKIEINTREIDAFDEPIAIEHRAENPWFTGEAAIPTFTQEEMLATKLRALLQRDKGRDLIDLSHALSVFDNLDTDRLVAHFARYLEQSGQVIRRAEAEKRMFAKLANPGFLTDIRPLLSADQAERLDDDAVAEAFRSVFVTLIRKLSGEQWAKTDEMIERFSINLTLAPELERGADP